jgi:ribosomal protein S18 acetylase RimI-like enzyme
VAAARLRAIRAFSLAVLGWPVFAALERHQPGEWYLQAVAVRPQARGLGLGSTLLRDALTRAVAADCDTLTLDVDVANEGAIALYERLGLEVVSTSRRAVLLGDVRVHRMAVTVKSSDSHPGR